MPATGKKRTKWNQLASIANNCNKNLKEKWEKNHEMLIKSQYNERISWLESWWKYLICKVGGYISKRICKWEEGRVQKCLEGIGMRSLYLALLLYYSLENLF